MIRKNFLPAHYSRAGLERRSGPAHDSAVEERLDEPGRVALALAREAVERYVRTGLVTERPPDVPGVLGRPSGVFVSLRVAGRLRGCVGTLAPARPDAAREIVACAIAAASTDPRFPPVRPDELAQLRYEVDVVGVVEDVADPADLDPKIFGVLVEGEGRRGVLLPDLEGVDSVDRQIAIARSKAGLAAGAAVRLSRFRVHRFVEPLAAPEVAP
jgi:MEMO1 family protein